MRNVFFRAPTRSVGAFLLFACAALAVTAVWADAAQSHEDGAGRVVVHVTSEGFEPRSVEVESGTTVVFENVDRSPHWPASDDHPMHDLYPGFDPQKPLAPNAQWSFTFDRAGEWEYHDHMNPYLTGKISVVDDGADDGASADGKRAPEQRGLLASIATFVVRAYETAVSSLTPGERAGPAETDGADTAGAAGGNPGGLSDTEYQEVENDLVSLVRDEDPRAALDKLRAETATSKDLMRSCHALVHEIGREAYEKYGDFGEAMKYQDELCNSGYLHGVIESTFSESDDVFTDMKAMCGRYEPGSFSSWQCYHGIGHGVMFYTGNDLPRSLEMCDGFRESFGRSSCVNGVFMENFNTDQKLHLSDFLREENPLYPCPQQADRHKVDCYMYAPTYFLSLNPNDYAGALQWCTGAERGFRSACAYGTGMQAIKENLSEPRLVESICASGRPEQREPCIAGMADLYINHHASLEPARELCARLEAPNRPACYGSVKSHSSLF